MLMNEYMRLVFLLFVFFFMSYRVYIAWFKPNEHKLNLQEMGKSYRGWSSYTEGWVASAFGYWFTRFMYLFGFVIATVAFIQKISELFFR